MRLGVQGLGYRVESVQGIDFRKLVFGYESEA